MSTPERRAPVSAHDYPPTLLVSVLTRLVEDAVARALSAAGFDDLTRAHGIVFEVLDPEGSRSSDMAARARMTKQSMGELVAHLERLGYLLRTPDPFDRRAKLVVLTPRGRAAVEAGRQGLAQMDAEWAGELGPRATAQLQRSLARLATELGQDHLR